MFKEIFLVFLLYIFAVLFRSFLALQDSVLLIYPDELTCLDPARSFIQSGYFAVHNINNNWEPILYSIFLAPFTLIKNTYIQIKVLKLFNCFLMCSSIFPVYLLSRKVMKSQKNFLVCFLTAIIPEFTMTEYFMAENLFFLCQFGFFILCMYLFVKHVKDKKLFCYV